jgi:peptidoglycan/xylan/chitin deacetylase (PgdA/CDA1 family)
MSVLQKISARAVRSTVYLSRDLQHKLGLGNGIYKYTKGNRIILYHGVCNREPLKFNTLFITKKTFEAHLKFYKKHFNVVSLDDYYAQKFCKDKFNICLTFDDGFANNHKYVLPLLQQYQVPATFFITAIISEGYDVLWNDFISIFGKYGPDKIVISDEGYIKNRHNKYISTTTGIGLIEKLWGCGFSEKEAIMKTLYPLSPFKTNQTNYDYWQQMSVTKITELSASPFVTIGAHSLYHNDLARINIDDAIAELVKSKTFLENITQKSVSSFAFPYGSYSPEVIVAAKRAGYTQLLATAFLNQADKDDDAIRERFTINPFISVNNQMRAIIKDSYE